MDDGGTKRKDERKLVIAVVDSSAAMTGALRAIARQSFLTADFAETIIFRPNGQNVSLAGEPVFRQAIKHPVALLRRSPLSLFSYPVRLLVAAVRLVRALRRVRADVLILNDFFYLEGALTRLLGFRGRIITWVRIDPRRFGFLGKVWLAAARLASNELVAVSRFIQQILPAHYKTSLIYDSVPAAEGRSVSFGQRILFVGNYTRGKGHEAAIAAFHTISGQFPNATLRFVGGDLGLERNRRFKDELEALARGGPGGPRIEICGFAEDVGDEYKDSAMLLNFSQSESFSLTCLEGAAHGLPVIATISGGPQEIVEDAKTGFLVPVGDVAAMADRMTWLLANPELSQKMGEAAARRAASVFGEGQFLNSVRRLLIVPQATETHETSIPERG